MELTAQQKQFLDPLVYKELKEHIFFFKGAKEIVVFTPDSKEIKSISSEKNLRIWIDQNFPNLFRKQFKMAEDEVNKVKKSIFEILLVDLQVKNQYSVLSYRRDPWATEAKVDRDDHKLDYFAPGFYLKEYRDPFNIDAATLNAIVEDYREHFPQFDDFLNWLISVRFTDNRRTSYTYLRVNPGFGKSFFASLFENQGTGRKILQTQLKHNSASDLSPADFRNSFILMIDEFTHFAQELKDLTHGMHLSAKYQLSEYVPLYAKVFLSAEKSTSFFGDAGVDAQLADRVSVLDLSDSGKLEHRKKYKENTKLYHEAVSKYIFSVFKNRSDHYIALGELQANVEANKVLDKHFNKYKTASDTIARIREKCVEYLREFSEWYSEADSLGRSRNTFFERLVRVVAFKNEDEIVTKDIVKMYEILISEAGDQFAKTAKFKQTMLDEVFDVSLAKQSYKCSGKTVRGVLINLAKLEKVNRFQLEIENVDGTVTSSEMEVEKK